MMSEPQDAPGPVTVPPPPAIDPRAEPVPQSDAGTQTLITFVGMLLAILGVTGMIWMVSSWTSVHWEHVMRESCVNAVAPWALVGSVGVLRRRRWGLWVARIGFVLDFLCILPGLQVGAYDLADLIYSVAIDGAFLYALGSPAVVAACAPRGGDPPHDSFIR